MLYKLDQIVPVTLVRNQLHIVTTYDACGSHSMTGTNNYYPPIIIVHIEFQLPYHIKHLAVNDHAGSSQYLFSRSKLSLLSANATQAKLQFWTNCNKTAPVEPAIYFMNHNGMLVVGISSDNVPFNVIANQYQPLDDEVVTFNIYLVADPAVRIYFSVALICSMMTITLM